MEKDIISLLLESDSTIPRMTRGLFQPHLHFEIGRKERTAGDERAPDVKVLVVEHLVKLVLSHVEYHNCNNCSWKCGVDF